MEKIKIMIVVNELLRGGAQRIILDIAKNYDTEKFDLKIVLLKSYKNFGDDVENILDEVRETGVEVIEMNGAKKFKLKDLFALKKLFKEKKPDIVHTFLPYSGIVGRVAGRLAGVKGIMSTQCNLPIAYKKSLYLIDKITLLLSTTWIAATEGIEISYGGSTSSFSEDKWKEGRRHFTIVAGVDLPSFDSRLSLSNREEKRKEIGVPKEATVVMMNARLISWKGPDNLVEAMDYLSKAIHVVIVGWGPLESKLRAISKKGKFEDRIHFLGSRNDVVELLGAVDIYAQTHKYTKGGDIWVGPNTSQMEACAAGVPSMSTAVPMIELLIEDKVTGVLAEPNNPKDIARAIQYLIDNPEEARAFAKAARSRVEEKYSVKSMVEVHQNLYRTMFMEKNI